MTSTIPTSLSLLGRASSGDQVAWQRMVQLYGPLVYSWARRAGLQPADAADATQETFAAVTTRLNTYDPNRAGATFRGWLWTITRNKAADRLRSQLKQASPRGGSAHLAELNAVAEAQPADQYQDNPDRAAEHQEIVRRALSVMRTNFEPTTWQAFWRTVVDGLTPDEVAIELSLSRWAVYKARSRVLHCLRTELQGLEPLE